jgi:hypothetical protein
MRCHPAGLLFLITLFLLVSCPSIILSEPSDSFLGGEIDFEDILSDIPRNFSIETAGVRSIASLPSFDNESALTVIRFRDSLSSPRDIADAIDTIPDITPLQRMILTYLSFGADESEAGGFSGYIRNGYMHKPDSESLSEGKYYVKTAIEKDKNVKFTAVGERDPFEPRALDLLSANLSMKSEKTGTHIVLGDFRPEFGQHLVFSRYGRNYTNGTNVTAHNSATVGNSLFDESFYLRGAYVSVRKGKLRTDIFSSRRYLDASLDGSGNAVTIRNTGYHNSGTSRENLSETIHTARVSYTDQNRFSFGIAGIVSQYSPSLAKKTDDKNINSPEGSNFGYVSLDGTITAGSSVLFFEHVESRDRENATVAGFRVKNKNAGGSVLVRNYSEGYWAPRAGGFSSFGKTSNERGVYSALQAKLPHSSSVTVSMDIARTLSRTFLESMPLSRRRLNMLLVSKFSPLLSGRLVAKSVTDSSDGEKRWSCRAQLARKFKNAARTGIRSSVAWSQSGGEGGIYSDISLYSYMKELKINVSAGVFDIPGYASRFYRYEYDVPGRGFTRAVWGKGAVSTIVLSVGPFSVRYRMGDSDAYGRINELAVQSDFIF